MPTAVAQEEARKAARGKVDVAEQCIILDGVSWETYERLTADFAERRVPRFAYDRGVLEIASPTPRHERDGFALATVVTAVAEELAIDHLPVGSTTYRREALGQGFEADQSFYIVDQRFARDLEEIDPRVDPPPDLVIEIDVSRSSLDKLAIYAGFGVPEVWRCQTDRVASVVLEGGTYRETSESQVLPPLTADVLTRFLLRSRETRRLEWVREVRARAREHRPSGA
jgi:Uma2 family endonuclease